MSAPKRVVNWALVLAPVNGSGPREALGFGRQACRTAYQQGLQPIFPFFYCLSFMTEEEVGKELSRVSQYWARRVSKLWVCLQPDETHLDPVTHDILLFNEGHMRASLRHHEAPNRLPVYRFWVQDNGVPRVSVLERGDVSALLRQNIVQGLFRGYAAAG